MALERAGALTEPPQYSPIGRFLFLFTDGMSRSCVARAAMWRFRSR